MTCSVLKMLVLLMGLYSSASALDREKQLIFDKYPGQKLTLPQNMTGAKQESTLVEDNMGCVFKCTSIHWCRSINFKTTPQSIGQYVCELLSSDQFTNNSFMSEDITYNHYSVKNPCEENPCRNDGECIREDRKNYQCKCKAGFRGEHCEKAYVNVAQSSCNYTKIDCFSGRFTSPYHPGNYKNRQTCWWLLNSTGRVSLTFESFNTETRYDLVQVYNGSSSSSPSLGAFHGTSLPPTITGSLSTQMYVKFTSDGSNVRSGFSARYQGI